MADEMQHKLFLAKEDFQRARRQAALEAIMARLQGRSTELLPYEEVRRKLGATGNMERGLREIPVDAIVGSVGRYTDFTRTFLPLKSSDEERWAKVKIAVTDSGFDPIEVYQIGDAYFVRDGNHRVSIARRMGSPTIPAYVTEIRTKAPFSPDMQPDDLIRQEEYANFLERTRLDEQRPEADLETTVPGRYRRLEQQIEAHQAHLRDHWNKQTTFPEAAADWYDYVYLPVARLIREKGILQDFPGRTQTDLYLWILEHRDELSQALGWDVTVEAAATNLVEQTSAQPDRVITRIGDRLKDALLPSGLTTGPEPGTWRQERVEPRERAELFCDTLVALSGTEIGWHALEQAIVVARRERGRLVGLHVVPSEEAVFSDDAKAMRVRFEWLCNKAEVPGQFVVRAGQVTAALCEHARWTDLVVANLAYPPPPQPLARLKSGFRTLVRRCPRPILAVPGDTTELNSALLAFDGSPKAHEALYAAAYLAGAWDIPLVVLTVAEEAATGDALAQAQAYLDEHGVKATFEEREGPVAETILDCAATHASEFIVMGSYGLGAVRQAVLGSVVDQVLRESRRPMLICR